MSVLQIVEFQDLVMEFFFQCPGYSISFQSDGKSILWPGNKV